MNKCIDKYVYCCTVLYGTADTRYNSHAVLQIISQIHKKTNLWHNLSRMEQSQGG